MAHVRRRRASGGVTIGVPAWRLVGALGLAVLGVGCGSESGGKADEPVPPTASALEGPEPEYSIKAYLSREGEEPQLVRFGAYGTVRPRMSSAGSPSDSSDGAESVEEEADANGSVRSTEQELEVEVDGYAGVVSTQNTELLDLARGWADGWSLALFALRSCSQATGRPELNLRINPFEFGSDDGFFVFHDSVQNNYVGDMNSCDRVSRAQEVMVCAASRLAEVAQAVGPVTWEGAYGGSHNPQIEGTYEQIFSGLTITIPPQSTKDRFIARDMAMNVLGQALVAEWYRGESTSGWKDSTAFAAGSYQKAGYRTCTDAYLESSIDGTIFPQSASAAVFDTSGTWDDTGETQQTRAQNRLDAKIEVFSTAGRIMEKLVRDSVRDDLATAETLMAQAADPVQGVKRYWGHGSFGAPFHYGSANHALYRLTGPLELGNADPDGLNPLWNQPDLILRDRTPCRQGQYGPGADYQTPIQPSTPMTRGALNGVRTPTTPDESRISGLVASSGLVDPDGVLDTTSTPTWIREVVVDVLQKNLLSSGTSNVLVSEENINAVLEGVEDATLVFAVRHATALLQLYRDEGTTLLVNSGTPDPRYSPAAAAQGLFVVSGGIPLAELGRRDASLIHELQVQTQCSIGIYGDSADPADEAFQLGPIAAMQNPFLYGQSLRERLEFLQQGARIDAQGLATSTRAEVGEWAGTARLVSRYDAAVDQHVIEVHGVDPRDFGLSAVAFRDHLAAYSSLLGARCGAGVRSRCDGVGGAIPIEQRTAFNDDRGQQVFQIKLQQYGDFVEVALAAHDDGAGAYLGRMALVGRSIQIPDYELSGDVAVEALSPLREELVSSVFDGSTSDDFVSTCRTQPPIALPSKYCIDGMDRDMFVPLANELTSGGTGVEDSWRHYLSEAMAAAEHADELGEELIRAGIELTEEKERAAEEFADLCGVFPTDNAVSVSDGLVEVNSGYSSIEECVAGERFDVVFFRANPFGSPEAAYAALCATEPGEESPYRFCERSVNEFEVAELGLASSYSDLEAFNAVDCSEVGRALEVGGGHSVDYPAFTAVSSKDYASPSGLVYAASALQLIEDVDGGWVLLNRDRVVMGTIDAIPEADESVNPEDFYPACLGASSGCVEPVAAMMQAAFGNQSNPTESVRKAVESGMFHLGALAGGLPAHAIHYPVPAAVTTYLNEPASPPDAIVPLPALYGTGTFQLVSSATNEYDYHNAYGAYAESEIMETWVRLSGAEATAYRDSRWAPASLPYHWRALAFSNLSDFVVGVRPNSPIEFTVYDEVGSDADGPRAYIQAALSRWVSEYEGGNCQEGVFLQRLNRVVEGPSHKEISNGVETLEGWGQRGICGATSEISPAFVTTSYLSSPQSEGLTPYDGLFSTHTYRFTEWFTATGGIEEDWGWQESYNFQLPKSGLTVAEHEVSDDTTHETMAVERLNPLKCSPSDRVEMWLEREVRNDCEAAAAISRALTLSCVANHQAPSGEISFDLPQITSLSDLELLKSWNRNAANAFHYIAGAMFLVEVPKQAVANSGEETFDYASVNQADKGQHLINLEQAMRDVESGFADVSSSFRSHSLEIQDTILALQALANDERQRLLEIGQGLLALERESSLLNAGKAGEALAFWASVAQQGTNTGLSFAGNTHKVNSGYWAGANRTELAYGAGAAASSAAFGGAEIVNAYVARENAEYAEDTAQRYNQMLQDVNGQQAAAIATSSDIAQAREILALNRDSAEAQDAMREGLEAIYLSGTSALDSIRQIVSLETRAKILLARFAGADFIETEGQRIPVELTTALGKIYDVKAIRYQKALEEAKRSAYLARLAIEQKLGLRMSAMQDGIGTLEAPALWVDDLCSLSGIDYERLADATEGGATFAAEFADQYIGDYVQRLESFVENYNIEYPFQEATDRAIISLRDEGGAIDRRCTEQNPNKLLYSHNLRASGSAYDEDRKGAWLSTGCEDSHCINLIPEEGVSVDDQSVPPPEDIGSFTAFEVTAFEENVIQHSGPAGFLYQNVELEGGVDHSLTAWAGVIDDDEGEAVDYQMVVYDEDWRIAAVQFGTAVSTGTSAVFPEPTVMAFVPPSDGLYRIAIGKLNADAAALLAIGNMQLTEGGPRSYRGNTATRASVSKACGDQERTIQDMFVYRCEDGGCFHELEQPIYVDEERLSQLGGITGGGFGGSNFNYRLGSVALNLVGSQVLDCEESSESCYTQGYVSYDLRHATQSVALTSLAQDVTCFDFKNGNVRGAKALAIERTLSLPLSSEDSADILEQGFLKSELFGRPLSGGYHLRIWDEPELRWDNVEDIQFLVNYSYWSEVE